MCSPYTNVHTLSLSTAQPRRKLMCYMCQPEYLECAVACHCVMHCCEERGDSISAMRVVRTIIIKTNLGLFFPRIIFFKCNTLENKHLFIDNVTILYLLFLVIRE